MSNIDRPDIDDFQIAGRPGTCQLFLRNINKYWQALILSIYNVRQNKVILEMEMSAVHISQANLGNTNSRFIDTKPMNARISLVHITKNDIIGDIAYHL